MSIWRKDIDGQHPIKSEYLSILFFGSWSSPMEATQFAASIPAPIRQFPHGNLQGHGLYIVTQRIHLRPRINHLFSNRLDVVARAVKTALDFGRRAALDFYRPMLATRNAACAALTSEGCSVPSFGVWPCG